MKQSTFIAVAAGLALSVVLLQGCKGSHEQPMDNMDQAGASMSAPTDSSAPAMHTPAAPEMAAPAAPEMPAAPAMPSEPAAAAPMDSGSAQ